MAHIHCVPINRSIKLPPTTNRLCYTITPRGVFVRFLIAVWVFYLANRFESLRWHLWLGRCVCAGDVLIICENNSKKQRTRRRTPMRCRKVCHWSGGHDQVWHCVGLLFKPNRRPPINSAVMAIMQSAVNTISGRRRLIRGIHVDPGGLTLERLCNCCLQPYLWCA